MAETQHPSVSSFWRSCSSAEPAPHILTGERRADVAIIGGGILGLSAARALAEAGMRAIVLEAGEIGCGASGRANGQVVPGLKLDPDKIRRLLDLDRAEQLLSFAGTAPDRVFALIERYAIRCDAVRHGWIQAAHAPNALPSLESRVLQWQRLGAPIDLIPAHEVADRLGTTWYVGALADRRGGSLDPLAYTRGLATAAVAEGALLYEHSPATIMSHDARGWQIGTPGGRILADRVLVCTNGQVVLPGDNWRRCVIRIRVAQIVSAPLSHNQWRSILPGGECAVDTSRLLTSFRLTLDHRLIMGGGLVSVGPERAAMFRWLQRAAAERFTHLGPLEWQYGWTGILAVTPGRLPHIWDAGDGRLVPVACNGRGIALATTTGEVAARVAMGQSRADAPIPVATARRMPLHSLQRVAVPLSVLWNGLRDRRDRRLRH
jgi:sarcosine oxidase